jgi:hypothetical protein
VVEKLSSFCSLTRKLGRLTALASQTVGEAAIKEIPEDGPGDDGWLDRQTMDGKGTSYLSLTVMLIEQGRKS